MLGLKANPLELDELLDELEFEEELLLEEELELDELELDVLEELLLEELELEEPPVFPVGELLPLPQAVRLRVLIARANRVTCLGAFSIMNFLKVASCAGVRPIITKT